jgi:hypothetical protein
MVACASLVFVTIPTRAGVLPQSNPRCCAEMTNSDQSGGGMASHCPGNPMQQKQCCAACALSLTLFPGTASSFVYLTGRQQMFDDTTVRAFSRTDRPPVPPPRSVCA